MTMADSKSFALVVSVVKPPVTEESPFGEIDKIETDIYPTLATANDDFALIVSRLEHPSSPPAGVTKQGNPEDEYRSAEFVYPTHTFIVERFC